MDLIKLTEAEFERIAKLVYDRTGIHMPHEKLAMLSNRLRKRLRALNLDNFEAYYKLMCSPSGCEDELPHFLSAVTTNETYFFRNDQLWKFFAGELVPHWVATKSGPGRNLRIWSAASSSGEEAHTTAISLLENLPDPSRWNITIIGSDISKNVLDKAKAAVYNDYAVSRMSPAQLKRWFTKTPDNSYQLSDEVRKLVKFQFHNLREDFPNGRFDLVFLRNVLMYFDTPMKKRVIQVVSNALAPGGHLIVGDVDPIRTIPELSSAMTLEYKRPGVYFKAAGKLAGVGDKQLVKA